MPDLTEHGSLSVEIGLAKSCLDLRYVFRLTLVAVVKQTPGSWKKGIVTTAVKAGLLQRFSGLCTSKLSMRTISVTEPRAYYRDPKTGILVMPHRESTSELLLRDFLTEA